MPVQRFFYCPRCGKPLVYVHYKERARLTCSACGYIFYENPVVGVAGILLNEECRILLGRRKAGIYAGLWCIPCGYLEYDEDIRTGLIREFKEETNLEIEVQDLYAVQSNFHDPDRHSVGVWFLVRPRWGELKAGDDLEDVSFFNLYQLPPLAFPTDLTVINQIIKERGRTRPSD